MVSPGPIKNNQFNLNIIDSFKVDEFLVNKWDTLKQDFINSLIEWISDKKGIFIFSVGPISKVVIPLLYEQYNYNTYLDIGSSFDLLLKGTTNRYYINPEYTLSKMICDFNNEHIIIDC